MRHTLLRSRIKKNIKIIVLLIIFTESANADGIARYEVSLENTAIMIMPLTTPLPVALRPMMVTSFNYTLLTRDTDLTGIGFWMGNTGYSTLVNTGIIAHVLENDPTLPVVFLERSLGVGTEYMFNRDHVASEGFNLYIPDEFMAIVDTTLSPTSLQDGLATTVKSYYTIDGTASSSDRTATMGFDPNSNGHIWGVCFASEGNTFCESFFGVVNSTLSGILDMYNTTINEEINNTSLIGRSLLSR